MCKQRQALVLNQTNFIQMTAKTWVPDFDIKHRAKKWVKQHSPKQWKKWLRMTKRLILTLFGASERYKLQVQFKRFQLPVDEFEQMPVPVDELWTNAEERIMSRRYDLSIDNIYAGNSPHANLLSTKTQLLSGADTSLQLLLPHNCITGSLDLHIPEWIWKKAGRILPQSNTIFPAPLRESKIRTFSIMSERGSIPHFVQVNTNLKATCTCTNFKPKQICWRYPWQVRHMVQGAEDQGWTLISGGY